MIFHTFNKQISKSAFWTRWYDITKVFYCPVLYCWQFQKAYKLKLPCCVFMSQNDFQGSSSESCYITNSQTIELWYLLMSLKFICCSLLTSYVPHNNTLIKTAWEEKLLLWVPSHGAYTPSMTFQCGNQCCSWILQFQHCDLTRIVTNKSMFWLWIKYAHMLRKYDLYITNCTSLLSEPFPRETVWFFTQ